MNSSRLFLAALLLVILASRAAASSQQLYLDALLDFERYAESNLWHDATGPGQPPDSGYWGDGGNAGNGGIRGTCGIAVAYAALVKAQPGDPATSNRLARIRKALNYAANTHVSGAYVCVNGQKWGWSSGTVVLCSQSGSDWQTPEWSGSMGLACVLVQSNLPLQTILDCQRAVASEADHRASLPPCSGYIGDTKAEENGWQGNVLALAAAWMKTNVNAATWLTAAKSYLANTYTVADTSGDPLAAWVSTITLYPGFALENHNFYHPTYEMVAGMSSGDSLLMARLADTNIAAQLQPYAEHNVMAVWNTNLASMVFDSGEFAYPSGLDWELHDYEQNSYLAWIAAHFNDPLARWADGRLAQLLRYRQIVNGDGTFVGPSSGGFYREAVEARRTAIAWLHWANADFPSGPTNLPAPVVVHYPDVGVIAQRSSSGFVSVSYKNNIMGMIEASAASVPTNAFITTPALPGIFGHGPLGNPTSASLLSFTTNGSGFAAQLLVQNGANGSTRVYVSSSGESVGIVEVPLPAGGVTGSGAGCFTNGIENDPLTGGSRLIEWGGGSTNVVNFSGIARNITNLWLCVAGRYGMAAGPGGYFRYQAAAGYNRLGAAQDYLHVIPQTRVGPRYAVWFPNRNAAQTAALAGQITWLTNGSNTVLTFPGPAGVTNVITALLTSGNGTWGSDADGNWSDPSRWTAGNIADGASSTADFSTLDITADRIVTLNTSRSIGALRFGDSSGMQNWSVNSSGGSVLTLSAAAPSIVVNQNLATLSVPLAGTGGFTKSGPGTLVLTAGNALSGTVFLDGNSTSANDGAIRLTTSAALTNVSALSIRNNTGPNSASSLQLDGSSEDLRLSMPFTNSCRANLVPNVLNLAGSNTLSGSLLMQVGGSNVVVQSDGGTLVLAGTLQYIGTFTSPRSWNFFGNGTTRIDGAIFNGANGATISVGKYGGGDLTLNGPNTYDGATTLFAGNLTINGSQGAGPVNVLAGTLAGTGTINGPVTVSAGGTLSPGDQAVGSLTINNALTNAGVLLMRLNKSGSGLTNDTIKGLSNLACGGTLQLAVTGNPLSVNDNFKLFYAATGRGAFTNIVPPAPGVGLAWNTNALAGNGTLSVVLGDARPLITQVALAGTNLIWSGTGGASASGYTVLSSSNLTLRLTNWMAIGTAMFDTNGGFVVTNALTPGVAQQFYVIRIP